MERALCDLCRLAQPEPGTKLADLETCASLWGKPVVDAARDWLEPQMRDRLIPQVTLAPEVELFQSDLELLLPIMAHAENVMTRVRSPCGREPNGP